MRIGFVTSSFPRTQEESAGIFVLEMAKAMAARGHDVEIVAPGSDVKPSWSVQPAWLGAVRAFEAPYAPIRAAQRLFYGPGAPERFEHSMLYGSLAVPATLGLYAAARRRSSRWDAFVSHWLVPAGLAARHANCYDLPHLAIVHSGDLHLLRNLPGGARLAAHVVRSCATVGCVSQALRQELIDLLPPWERGDLAARIAVTPMGCDDRLSEIAARRTYIPRERTNILFMGRLVPIKGLDVLLEALSEVRGTRLVVAGDGPSRPEFEQLAQRRGLSARFVGFIPPQRRSELLAEADLFVLPSRELPSGRHEGLPLALVEAMASGLPVVASRTGGVCELVEHAVTGLLVPQGSARDLASALRDVVGNTSLRQALGIRAAQRALGRKWSTVAQSFEALLELHRAHG